MEPPDFGLQAMTDELRGLVDASIGLDRRTCAMAIEAGLPILTSTDASFANPWIFHGASLADELEIYGNAVMTRQEALSSTTAAPPRFLGLDDQDGRIAPGRRADHVLLGADPLPEISAVRSPEAVMVRGRLLDRPMLDALRAETKGAVR